MILSRQILPFIPASSGIDIPAESLFSLPEKVMQFGTGVLLRGLPDYFIDKANKKGIFNGRIVLVKSTALGDSYSFQRQDNLYTQLVRGIAAGRQSDETIVNASISRLLTAAEDWKEILNCAATPGIQIIFSNTTEVGIALVVEDITLQPPSSFPAKLLACLQARYEKLGGTADSGMVIIPTELIPGNGEKLKNIVIELAWLNNLEPSFIQWIGDANDFCNSLVDRIVPGKLTADKIKIEEERLGYKDDLMIMSEVYCLWAIETRSAKTKELLSFARADDAVIISNDIRTYRELKLRLLNGPHTFTCGLAFLLGFKTVKEAMADKKFYSFLKLLMMEEIVPALSATIPPVKANAYSQSVLDRFSNPFIDHQWINICLQYSSKMQQRNLPLIQQYTDIKTAVPERMAFGFAAYLLFMKSERTGENQYLGNFHGRQYGIKDDKAGILHEAWSQGDITRVVHAVLVNKSLWGNDLSLIPGFADSVIKYLQIISGKEYLTVLNKFEPANTQS